MPDLPYTYFLGTQTVSLCQDQLYVSRTHDVVRACDEDGGYRAVCDRGDHHRRTIRRHGWSARGNAASLGRPGLCVSGPRSQFHFHFFERGCEPRTEQRYGDLSHGLCSDRPTTLDVAQHIPCICNVAGGRFGAQPRPMGRMVGICSQRHRIHRLYLHRPAILPRTHPTNHTTLVRLRVTSGFGGFPSRRGRNSKLPNWPDGKRRACCVPGHLHQHGAANPIRRSGPSEAAKRGAVAYLLRSLTDSHRLPHTGALNYENGTPRIPAAALAIPDAEQLERLTALGPVRIRLLLTPTVRENAPSWNVVGEIKGADRPDEIVLIGGHLDSWDLGTGASDDGAGMAITFGAARLIAGLPQRPSRTIRVALFGAEEMDFSGIHRLYLHRPAILPRTHPTNHTTLVRLRVTSGFGGFPSRRGRNSKLPNWPDGKRRACCVPGHLHQHGAANPIRRSGPSEAAKRGAVAYLLRSLTDSHRLPHTGALNYENGTPRIPAAALAIPDAEQLERLTALGPCGSGSC